MEKNKVKVIIANTEYTLVTEEEPEYVQRVAILVDKKVSEITACNPHLSTAMSAMLTAINLADDLLKNDASADNLRGSVAEYSKKIGRLEAEASEKDAKIEKLEKEIGELKLEKAKRDSAHGGSKH